MTVKSIIKAAIFFAKFIPGLSKYAIAAEVIEPVAEEVADDIAAKLATPRGQAAIAAGKAAIQAATQPAPGIPAGVPPADIAPEPEQPGVIESPVPYGG